MIKTRYMVWAIRPGTEDLTSDLDYDWKGFATLERAEAEAQAFSNRTGMSTSIEHQTYEISRHGYEILESDFGPWGTRPHEEAGKDNA